MKIDLHMHSALSKDGELSFAALAQMAEERGMNVIALSDHDTAEGVQEMTARAAERNIEGSPAIEGSTLLGPETVHVLGLGIDPQDPYLKGIRIKIEKANEAVFEQRLQKLNDKYGLDIELDQVLREAAGKNPWFVLIHKILKDPRIQDHPDFQDYLPGGSRSDPAPVNFYWDKCTCGSDLHVPSWFPDFYETIDRIHAAGGAAVIAHPFRTFYQKEDLLQSAIDRGIDGLEAYSNYHTLEMNEWYAGYAERNGLLITCGSDFHGINKPSIRMGEYGYDGPTEKNYGRLKERMALRKEEAGKK